MLCQIVGMSHKEHGLCVVIIRYRFKKEGGDIQLPPFLFVFYRLA